MQHCESKFILRTARNVPGILQNVYGESSKYQITIDPGTDDLQVILIEIVLLVQQCESLLTSLQPKWPPYLQWCLQTQEVL
jgi:hypothetical protein